MADIDIAKAPPNSAVLPFFATGAIAFWVLCLLLFLSPHSLRGHYFSPHLLSIVHTAALGWGTMMIFGAAHQLLPVICERALFSRSLAALSWYTLTAGTIVLVFSFRNFHTGWPMITGGALVTASALAFFINTLFTGGTCIRHAAVRLFICSSATWLVFTVTLGLLLAIHLRYPFFKQDHLHILKLHAHAGLAGWLLQLIAGVSAKLVPMFLLGKSEKGSLLYYAFVLQNAALALFLADGFLFGLSPARGLVYAAIETAGIACWLWYLGDAFRHRVRKNIDAPMKHSLISFLCLGLALTLVPVVLYSRDYRWAILYGMLLFMGWVTGIILGKTFKTLPFIIWNGQYKQLSGKVKVPLPKHLYSEQLVQWQFGLYIAGVTFLGTGIAADNGLIIRAATIVWLLLSWLYVYNVMKVLLHKTKTAAPTP
jgi:hypothetical protein